MEAAKLANANCEVNLSVEFVIYGLDSIPFSAEGAVGGKEGGHKGKGEARAERVAEVEGGEKRAGPNQG